VTSATGAISITGQGGGGSGINSAGIVAGQLISSTTGDITLSGIGGGTNTNEDGNLWTACREPRRQYLHHRVASATGSGSGIVLAGSSTISTTISGTVTVLGTAKGSGANS